MTPTPRISRRQVLGLAAGGAAGVVGLRVFLPRGELPPATSAAGPAGAWPSPLRDSRMLAAHLLRRAGFGYSDAELDEAASLSYGDLVDRLVAEVPAFLPPPSSAGDYRAVSQAWLAHMATTRSQFPERMTLFWHGVLTSDYRKAGGMPFLWQQNDLYRSRGRGDLRSLLVATTSDPLMIRYLDLDQSSARAPNENYSRELMELFTLGVGNFGESDVREGARALSGIRIALFDHAGNLMATPRRGAMTQQAYASQLNDLVVKGARFRGVVDPRVHDHGTKTFLGRTGNLGPEEVIDTILAKDACALFIATRALTHFSTPTPSREYAARVAAQFRHSRYDIATLMRAIFLSDEFKAPENYRSLVRSPADYLVATMRALGDPHLAGAGVAASAAMDQVLYDPPTVAGWPANAGWISSSTWLARINFAGQVVGRRSLPDPATALRNQLDGVVGSDTAQGFGAGSGAADRWYAILAGPEFHLK